MEKLIANTILLILSFVAHQSSAQIYPITASDKVFFERLQRALSTDDIEWFSEAVSYPIVLRLGKGELKLENKTAVKEHAALIFTTHLKTTVRNQATNSLFKNWQGVMIGKGEIWFSEVAETTEKGKVWVNRITGINLPEDQSKKIEKGGRQKDSPVSKP